jgi:hypothetical protein
MIKTISMLLPTKYCKKIEDNHRTCFILKVVSIQKSTQTDNNVLYPTYNDLKYLKKVMTGLHIGTGHLLKNTVLTLIQW